MPELFDPIQLGDIKAPNRIIMAPLTRSRASRDHVPTKIMADYYSQRASAGLIIAEATGISREGLGFPYAPGIWTSAQIEGWEAVTDAVHRGGGRIMSQLWHMGRLAHPSFSRRSQGDFGVGDCGSRGRFHVRGKAASGVRPRARDKRNTPPSRRLPGSGGERVESRLRRCRSACGERLSAGSVPARQLKPANGCLWWKYRESHPFAKRGNSRSDRSGGSRSYRRTIFAQRCDTQRGQTTAIRMRCFQQRPKLFRNWALRFLKFASLRRRKCSRTPRPARCGPLRKCLPWLRQSGQHSRVRLCSIPTMTRLGRKRRLGAGRRTRLVLVAASSRIRICPVGCAKTFP